MPRSARLLIAAVAAAGLALVAIRVPGLREWSAVDLEAFVAVAVAIAISEQLLVTLPHGEESENFTITDAVWAAGVLLAPADALVLGVVAGTLAGQLAQRWAPHKVAFNTGQFVLAVSAAGAVASLIAPAGGVGPLAWAGAAAGLAAAFVVNAGSVALVIALVSGRNPGSVFLHPLKLNVLHWIGNIAIGIAAAVIWSVEPAGVVLLLVPLVLLYLAYRGWLRSLRERDLMHEIAAAAEDIARGGDLAVRVPGDGADHVGDLARTLNRMLDRLEGGFRRERLFIREASHELRTPVAISMGHLELLGSEPTPDELGGTVELVVDELQRIGRLVDDLTSLARAEEPDFVRPEPIVIGGFLEEVGRKAAVALGERLTVELPTNGAEVEADPQRMTQALLNMLHNAALHGAGSRVVLRAVPEPASWRFEVADNGEGVPSEHESTVFQPFHRASTVRPGSGLGLAIVARIAEAHGGSAGLDNAPGDGATFWVRLPR